MNKMLAIEINCGDTTCAEEPGKFCRYLRVSRFGSAYHCQLFSEFEEKRLETLQEKDGWLQRHPRCLAAEKIL